MTTKSKFFTPCNGAIALWAVAIVLGIGLMLVYDYQCRPTDSTRANLEAEGVLSPVAGRPTLLFFTHPKCPCTRSSVEELAKLIAQCPDIVTYGVVVIPPGVDTEFRRGHTIDALREIPHVRIIEDNGGVLADKYNAHTSGQTLLYDREGKLVFNGGITFARGHVGDNEGRTKVVSMVRQASGSNLKAESTPVFGCGLRGDGDSVLCARQKRRLE